MALFLALFGYDKEMAQFMNYDKLHAPLRQQQEISE